MPLFTRNPEEYTRDLDMHKFYIEQVATTLSTVFGDDIETTTNWVKKVTSKDGTYAIRDPRVIYLTKETPGNRELKIGTMSEYLIDVEQRQAIMSPTMAVYLNPKEKRSLLAEYILINLAMRSKVKKEMFVAKMSGDVAVEKFKNIVQSTYKIKNNSLSGAHASPSTPLYNKSSHSTLTSVCRCSSGPANASNERFASGNRHYFTADIAIANIMSVVINNDYDKIQHAMDKYNLHYPSVEEVLTAVKYSTDLYWVNADKFKYIEQVVSGLSPIQRAAYLYTADFHHLRVYNESFVYHLLKDIITLPTNPVTDDPVQYIKALDDDEYALVGLMSGDILNGATIKDMIDKRLPGLELLAANAKHLKAALESYADLYAAFWISDNPPGSIAAFPSSIRRSAIISDTDSTIFTVQDWTTWYSGQLDFSKTSNDIAAVIVYFCSQLTKHTLAIVSGNMGVAPDKVHKITMKNEYVFPLASLTTRSKHYYGYMSAREGNVYLEPELEVKGVALKNSKIPSAIMNKAHALIREIMDDIMAGKLIDLGAILTMIGDMERNILSSIENGKCDYLTTAQVKDEISYANPMSSPFIQYELWESVFANKYGHSDPPPYFAIKASLITDNKTRMNEWLENIEDPYIKRNLIAWLEKHGKKNFTTIYLPSSIVMQNGVPKEITSVIDSRKLVSGIMEPFYLILESLGYYLNTDNAINLVSDRH